jgi:hypothetical protein
MRHLYGLLIAGGLLLGPAVAANAQNNSMNAFGAYPAGIMTGSPYGANWSGFYGLNPGGMPLNTYNQPYNAYGANYSYMAPGVNTSYPQVGTNTYSSAYSAPGASTSSYYGAAPGYTTSPYPYTYGTNYNYNSTYNTYRRGLGLFRSRR